MKLLMLGRRSHGTFGQMPWPTMGTPGTFERYSLREPPPHGSSDNNPAASDRPASCGAYGRRNGRVGKLAMFRRKEIVQQTIVDSTANPVVPSLAAYISEGELLEHAARRDVDLYCCPGTYRLQS